MKEPTVITAREVALYLQSIGVPLDQFEPRDQLYACVDPEHMLGAHYDSTARLMQDLGLVYDEDWDCEDFTMTYVWWAIIAHRRAQREARQFWANTPAVFECWVQGITHAVAICMQSTHEGLRHFFVEPQPTVAERELLLPSGELPTISLVK